MDIVVNGTAISTLNIDGTNQLTTDGDPLPGKNTFVNDTFVNTFMTTIPSTSPLYEQGAAYYIIDGDTFASNEAYLNELSTRITTVIETPCFNEGTKILYLNKKMKDDYIPIEKLRKGDFIKTYKHGYRKIDLIGRNILINNPAIYKNCMYKMVKTETNGLMEDLIVTGGHSILVDSMTEEENELNEQLFWGEVPMIDKKYLLLAAVSTHFEQIKNKKPYVYYHLVLDNEDDDEARYGIWANGILTETPSKEFFKKQKFILY
jgi:hypothetical protein